MSPIVHYFLHSTSALSFYIDVVLTLSVLQTTFSRSFSRRTYLRFDSNFSLYFAYGFSHNNKSVLVQVMYTLSIAFKWITSRDILTDTRNASECSCQTQCVSDSYELEPSFASLSSVGISRLLLDTPAGLMQTYHNALEMADRMFPEQYHLTISSLMNAVNELDGKIPCAYYPVQFGRMTPFPGSTN